MRDTLDARIRIAPTVKNNADGNSRCCADATTYERLESAASNRVIIASERICNAPRFQAALLVASTENFQGGKILGRGERIVEKNHYGNHRYTNNGE